MGTDHIDIPSRYLCQNPLDFYTAEDLSDLNGVVLGDNNKLMWNLNPRRHLVQVYSIQFLNFDREVLDKEELHQICGTIEIDYVEVFSRKSGQACHYIDPEGFVRLSGPESPFWASDYVVICPKVYRGNQPGDFFHPANLVKISGHEEDADDDDDDADDDDDDDDDDEEEEEEEEEEESIDPDSVPPLDKAGISGEYLSSPTEFGLEPCHKVLTKDVKTTCGTMTVTYAILLDAADCYVTIKLLEWTGEGSGGNFYGTVIASDTGVADKRAKSLVFDRNKDEEILSVSEGEYIPLQRPVNMVSMGHDLELDISIYHKNKMGSRDDDLPILKQKHRFHAKCGNAAEYSDGSKRNASEVSDGSKESDAYASEVSYWTKESDENGSEVSDSSDESKRNGSECSDGSSESKRNGSECSDGSNESKRNWFEVSDGTKEIEWNGLNEAIEVCGKWCKFELKVYWLPCWSDAF